MKTPYLAADAAGAGAEASAAGADAAAAGAGLWSPPYFSPPMSSVSPHFMMTNSERAAKRMKAMAIESSAAQHALHWLDYARRL
jgi:hypothetical protein